MRIAPASRVVMRFSEKTGPPGVPEKPRTLLVLLLESASLAMANRHQPASQKYKDRDVTMVTAPFGESRKLLPPTMYLGPVSRAAIYSLPSFLFFSFFFLFFSSPYFALRKDALTGPQGTRADLSLDRILFFPILSNGPRCSIAQRSGQPFERKCETMQLARNFSEAETLTLQRASSFVSLYFQDR